MHWPGSRRLGAVLALFAGGVYVALMPPLYHFDGYMYRLKILGPFARGVNPHHILWHPIQVGLMKAFAFAGHTGTVPFQLFGVAVNCVTLALFCSLMLRVSRRPLIAAGSTLLVAFSPTFWHFGFQNLPYPLTYLSVVLFLRAWPLEDGKTPDHRQLAAAGAAIGAAIFLQQAAVLLVGAGCLTLLISGGERPVRRLARTTAWGAAVGTVVGAVYIGMAIISDARTHADFVAWITTYMRTEHSVKILWAEHLAKSVIGISRSVLNLSPLESYLGDNLAARPTLILYGAAGLTAVALLVWFRKKWFPVPAIPLFRGSALFTVSALSVAAWSAFVFSWEPTGHFWNLNLFPALVCLGILSCKYTTAALRNVAVLMIAVSGWNVYANHAHDQIARINFPDPLVASVRAHLTGPDIFIVPGRDWFAGMDYDLLFEALDRSKEHNPGRALLNDYVMKPGGAASWRTELEEEIRSVLDQGGKVFVADSLLWDSSYADLLQAQDPYSEFVHEQYASIDGPTLQKEVEHFFGKYNLVESDFTLGNETFYRLRYPAEKN